MPSFMSLVLSLNSLQKTPMLTPLYIYGTSHGVKQRIGLWAWDSEVWRNIPAPELVPTEGKALQYQLVCTYATTETPLSCQISQPCCMSSNWTITPWPRGFQEMAPQVMAIENNEEGESMPQTKKSTHCIGPSISIRARDKWRALWNSWTNCSICYLVCCCSFVYVRATLDFTLTLRLFKTGIAN